MNAGAVTEDNTAKLTLGTKLKLARSLTGLSTRAVAERLRPHHEVSHATIANYEKGDSTPPMAILVALAQLYDRPISWFLERSLGLSGVRYRNLKSRTKSSDLLRFEAETQQWLDAYIAVERRLNRPLTPKCSFPKVPANADVTEVAQDVRRLLNFASDAPIASIVEVLESFGVRVIEVPTALRIDGLAAVYGDQHIVALNSTVSGDRSRMNAAHEFAHIIYGDCSTEGHHSPEEEKRAFTFASTLLLPNSELKRAFEGYSMVRLVQFKERFGISLAAMVYRAEQLGFIQKKVAKDLWIEIGRAHV